MLIYKIPPQPPKINNAISQDNNAISQDNNAISQDNNAVSSRTSLINNAISRRSTENNAISEDNNYGLFKEIADEQIKDLLIHQRCINMSMDQFNNKEHINKNMCCVEFTTIIHNIKDTIVEKLEEIKNKIQVPFANRAIPLPIYISIAKNIEKDNNYLLYSKFIKDGIDYSNTFQEKYTFQGNMNIIIYIPNLMNNITNYTYYPSLEAYTNQNKWMEFITHPKSYFLKTINEIDQIKNKNFVYSELNKNICNDYGCTTNAKEDIGHMFTEIKFFLPTKCLQDNKYEENNHMKIKELNNVYDINSNKNGKIQDKYEDKLDDELDDDKNDDDKILSQEEWKELKNNALGRAFDQEFKKKINKRYNAKMKKDLELRNKSQFPGVQEINFKMFKLKPDNPIFTNKINFHYMPWGDKLLNNQYVLNENRSFHFEDIHVETTEIGNNNITKLIKFKSLNNKHFMNFDEGGKLSIYDEEDNDIKIIDLQISKNIDMIDSKNKYIVFNSDGGNIEFYSDGQADNKSVRVKLPKDGLNPYSIILDEQNPGNLQIYGLGFNKIIV